MAHVAEWKKEEVKDLAEMIKGHDVIGIVDLSDIPAKQLQKMRQNLREKAKLRMSRKTLISLALDRAAEEKENIKKLKSIMEGQPALIVSGMNPFKLFKILEKSKTPSPAKPGAIAPQDVIIPRGDTGFAPGPILGELQQLGIPARIERSKIVITEDHTILKAGDEISPKVAEILNRLDIQPLEVGIDLKAAYENETVYTSDILTIDENKTIADIKRAVSQAFNLSINALIYTRETIPYILQNAASKAFNLAYNAEIFTPETVEPLLSKAYAQMLSLAAKIAHNKDALDEELLEKITTKTKPTTKKEEEEEEEEEEAAAGLSALFG